LSLVRGHTRERCALEDDEVGKGREILGVVDDEATSGTGRGSQD